MSFSFCSDKSDIESQKGNNGRHQYSASGSGAGRNGSKTTVVTSSLASIPPDALYTSASKHTSVSTLSSKPDHEYENLKVRLEYAMSSKGHFEASGSPCGRCMKIGSSVASKVLFNVASKIIVQVSDEV